MRPAVSSAVISTGFTLIELMIVVAIVGILAVVAIPSYLNHTEKAKFSEVIYAIAPYKIAVASCIQQQSDLALCGTAGSAGIPADFSAVDNSTGYVASVQIGAQGVITATSQRLRADYTYSLTPTLHANGQVSWAKGGTCGAAGLC